MLEACDGKEALALCVKEDGGLDIVVLDIIMPVMGGSEFLDRVKCVRPDLKVLLMRGHAAPGRQTGSRAAWLIIARIAAALAGLVVIGAATGM